MRVLRHVAGLAFALAVTLGVGASPAIAEETPTLSQAEIEQIVRDYLMREPEVIYDAIQELQKRRQEAEIEHRRQALVQRAPDLYDNPLDPVLGNPDGSVTLVEFFDYRCTYCRSMVPAMQALLANDDDLRVVFKELPVLGPDSVRAAKAALASRKQDETVYEDFHFALMRAADLSEAGIRVLAEKHGLDAARLLEDMQATEIDATIDANYALARDLGIEGTPAFVVADQLVPGAVDIERLRALIDGARNAS